MTTIAALLRPELPRPDAIRAMIAAAVADLPSPIDSEVAQLLFGLTGGTATPAELRKRAAARVRARSADAFRKNQERRVLAAIARRIQRMAVTHIGSAEAVDDHDGPGAADIHPLASHAGFLREYTRRAEIEERFDRYLQRGFRTIAFVGLSGMGKTRLADHCTSKHSDVDKPQWFRATDREAFRREIQFACEHAGVYVDEGEEHNPESLFATYLCSGAAPRFVVVDGLAHTEELASLVPRRSRSIVVATCTYRAHPARNVAHINVGPLASDQAEHMARTRLPGFDRGSVHRLVACAAGYPLVIAHAARLVRIGIMTVDELCRALADGAPSFLGRIHHPVDGPLATVLSHTVDAIRATDPLAGQLLDCIAFLDYDKIRGGLPLAFMEKIAEANELVPGGGHEVRVVVAQAVAVLVEFLIVSPTGEDPINPITHATLKAALAHRLPQVGQMAVSTYEMTRWTDASSAPFLVDIFETVLGHELPSSLFLKARRALTSLDQRQRGR